MMSGFDTLDLRNIMWAEMEKRRLSPAPGDYRYQREANSHPLYGVTGAANLYAELGFDFGDLGARQAWCDRINAFQADDGTFHCVSGPEHAAAMAILALNILGGRPIRPVRNLAPKTSDKLSVWLNRMNWEGSTHKEFCSGVSTILASGFYDATWIETMRHNVEVRLDARTWVGAEEEAPWRVVSCIYHVLSGYDAAFLPYPQPALLWNRLTVLDYEHTRNNHQRTFCTDFDYAWLLRRLCHQMPEHFQEAHRRFNTVLDMMIAEWRDERERMLSATTHELYCQCIGWALYQNLIPERFTGPALQDTLNAPWLYRLHNPGWVTD